MKQSETQIGKTITAITTDPIAKVTSTDTTEIKSNSTETGMDGSADDCNPASNHTDTTEINGNTIDTNTNSNADGCNPAAGNTNISGDNRNS